MLPSCLAAIRRRRQGHAAAAGSGGIDHGRLPSGCTSGGRLPPLGRSNDRSPPTAMPTYPPHWAPPHARCRPFGARFQYGCFSAPQSCTRVFVGHLFALGARFRRRASRRFTPPAALSGPHTQDFGPSAQRGRREHAGDDAGVATSAGCTHGVLEAEVGAAWSRRLCVRRSGCERRRVLSCGSRQWCWLCDTHTVGSEDVGVWGRRVMSIM